MENITDLVHRRRSVRTFDGREVNENDLKKLALFMEKIENPGGYCHVPFEKIRWVTDIDPQHMD